MPLVVSVISYIIIIDAVKRSTIGLSVGRSGTATYADGNASRAGQLFNQRFEQVFATSFQPNANYQLTDFVTGNDESTQLLLQELSTQRVTRTLLVYGIANKQAYQLHITPWFGEHGQVHGFTVLLNNVNDFVNQTEILQQQNQQLQRQLSEFSQLRSVIGHELRPPLDAIIGILEQIDTKTLTAERHEVLTTLTQSSHLC